MSPGLADRLVVDLNRAHRKLAGRFGHQVRLVTERVWLGLLRRRHLDGITSEFYARAEELGTLDHNRRGLSSPELALAADWFGADGTALVLGAGGGREGIGLAELGFATTLVDSSPTLARAARSNLEALQIRGTVFCCPNDDLLRGVDGAFDVTLLGLGLYSHLADRRRRVALLRDLRGFTSETSTLVLSVYPRRHGGSSLTTRLSRAVARLSRSDRRPEDGERLREAYTRAFTELEIEEELDDGGWRKVDLKESGFLYFAAQWSSSGEGSEPS